MQTEAGPSRQTAASCSVSPSLLEAPAYLRLADMMVVLTAAALPWSTSATAIFMTAWLILIVPTIDWDELVRGLAAPACALPLAFFALADLGVLWSGGTWESGLHGLNPVSKLLLIPLLLYHFRRSERASWVLAGFVGSCTVLMMLSWIVLIAPSWKITATASNGVPVKNYIDQSQEFALCAFALAAPLLAAWTRRSLLAAAGLLALIAGFVANMLFVVSARTALIYMPVLLVLFVLRHLERRAALAVMAGALVAAGLVWTTSPYLRQRVADIAVEYRAFDANVPASTAQRLTYWQKSIRFIAEAPLLGHGTGSIRQLFEADSVGQTGLRAEIVSNPHNQTLSVAIQWGIVGVLVLYAMWSIHLRLFLARNTAAWIGLAVVVQNIVSSLLNSHLFDFGPGWIYVLGVGVAGGVVLGGERRSEPPERPL
ncbi:O-antigen ligase family protein [Bradyrhizobium sp. STM 3809]|uniref:O-antigen ligase family protein n=1 Tax=Bradyrhizobium sp. STM 3809 TaxID=551936 RepID=UPI0002F3A540|nr:O-antigen ligase family protein [Bradyrhizobium sp. STM 3809]